jgi:hypothetical protein
VNEPKHPTCVDVSALPEQPGSEWVCGPECPRDERPALPLDMPPTGRTLHNVMQRRREIT